MRAISLALFAVVVWAVNYPAMKVAFREIEPLAYTGWRFVLASAVVLGGCALRRERILPPRPTWPLAALLALSGIGVYQWFYALGVAETTSFAAALLNSVSPLIALLLVTVLGWEALSPAKAFGSLVAYAGVALFIRASHGEGLGSLEGNVLCIGAASCWAVFSVASSRAARVLSASMAQAAAFAGGTLFLIPYCLPSMLHQDYTRIGALSWTTLGLSGVLPLAFAFRAWTEAIRELGVSQTTSFSFLIPVVAGVTSALWTHERFTFVKVGAAAVVLLGLAITRLSRTT